MEYLTPVDIANRALQHLGAARIDPALGFAEDSRNASETAFAYPKLRRAELRRNVWRFATRRAAIRAIDTGTMLLSPSLWASTTTYFPGSIVADQDGNIWISRLPNNSGADPQNSPFAWEAYFGPMTVTLWAADSYFAGELVYTAAGDGTNRVYLSLQNGNQDTPAIATAYDATATYFKNQVITYASVAYMSLIDLNKGNTPNLAPPIWSSATTYPSGQKVGASDGLIYQALSVNVGFNPTTDGGVHWFNTGVLNPWTSVFVGGVGSSKWLLVGGSEFPNGVTLAPLSLIYPIGAGPSSQSSMHNVYRLPAGYIREAPQSPKAGSNSWLGGPSGITYNDWQFEGDFIVTADVGPIAFRFVADVTDVARMDDMFCEGLAARLALETCDTITQSNSQVSVVAKVYDEWINKAATVNGIEMGADVPPDDEYVSVRY